MHNSCIYRQGKNIAIKHIIYTHGIQIHAQYNINYSKIIKWPGASFTKLCDRSSDQLTHRRSHKLILLTNCYIALGCVVLMLSYVALRYTTRRKLHWYVRTGCTNSTYKHLCERHPWYSTDQNFQTVMV